MTDRLDSRYVLFEWVDGLLIATYHPDVRHIDRMMAEEIVQTRLKFQGDIEKVWLLIRASGPIEITWAAQEYFCSPDGIEGLAATAILTDKNPVLRQLAEWLLNVQQPGMPLRLYRDEVQARAWLLYKKTSIKKSIWIRDQKSKETP